jgi:hypothetical protein
VPLCGNAVSRQLRSSLAHGHVRHEGMHVFHSVSLALPEHHLPVRSLAATCLARCCRDALSEWPASVVSGPLPVCCCCLPNTQS